MKNGYFPPVRPPNLLLHRAGVKVVASSARIAPKIGILAVIRSQTVQKKCNLEPKLRLGFASVRAAP